MRWGAPWQPLIFLLSHHRETHRNRSIHMSKPNTHSSERGWRRSRQKQARSRLCQHKLIQIRDPPTHDDSFQRADLSQRFFTYFLPLSPVPTDESLTGGKHNLAVLPLCCCLRKNWVSVTRVPILARTRRLKAVNLSAFVERLKRVKSAA